MNLWAGLNMKHANISIFVPHAGCPHQCSFCNQKEISGTQSQPTPEFVIETIKSALNNSSLSLADSEIAFFGGSFTAIEREYMISLLKAAYPFTGKDGFKGIRVSTRPDAIDDEIISILKQYNVTAVELGAQRMDDNVLRLNMRGHTSADVDKASKLIKSAGISLGLQMMTGLYGDTYEGAVYTAKRIIELKPDTVRIYPTVIMENTLLGDLWKKGEYKTLTFEDTIKLCALLLDMFEQEGLKVIRLGLHASESLESAMLAGAYHPALRELCEGERYFNRVVEILKERRIHYGDIIIKVNNKNISKMIGQAKRNLKRLNELGYNCRVKVDNTITGSEIYIEC